MRCLICMEAVTTVSECLLTSESYNPEERRGNVNIDDLFGKYSGGSVSNSEAKPLSNKVITVN